VNRGQRGSNGTGGTLGAATGATGTTAVALWSTVITVALWTLRRTAFALWTLRRTTFALWTIARGTFTLRTPTTGAGAITVAVTARATALRGVSHRNVGTLGIGNNQCDTLVTRVKRGGRLRGQDSGHLHALHELVNVSAIDSADDRSSWDQRSCEGALRELGSRCTPRSDVAVKAGDFDLNSTRHRQPI
jgi:hypothetical protein